MPDPNAPTAPEVPAAGSCRVPGWVVFGPGYHKGRLYTKADCARLVANFNRLSAGANPYLKPKAKLGHDDEQRLAKSLGYPSSGGITGCRLTKDGMVEIDVGSIPLAVGSEINAGRINDGSVELDDFAPDPNDPAKQIDGPVLTGVAFLGEEQPAVKGCPPPRAVMDDGAEVPGGQTPSPWLSDLFRNYMAAARSPRTFSVGGRRVTRRTVRFSEVIPVRDQLLQTLAGMGIDTSDPQVAGMTDDQLQALVNQMNGDSFASKMKAKYAEPPKADPPPAPADKKNSDPPADQGGAMYAEFKKFADDCTKRLGAMEQAVGDMQKVKSDVAASAAFASRYEEDQKTAHRQVCEREVDRAVADGKVQPADRLMHVNHLAGLDNRKKFSEAENKANAGKTAFEVALAELHARQPSQLFSRAAVDTPATGTPLGDDFTSRVLESTGRGRAVKRSLETAKK